MLLPLLIPFLSFSFFQGHNNLECRITQIQVDLWWIPWLWLSMSSPIPHKETRFIRPRLPTATHHLPLMSRWWNPPREDSLALWPDCLRRRCHCKNDQDGGHLPIGTLASSPSPLSLPSLHLSSLKLLAKGWFLNIFFFSRSGFFLSLQNKRSCLCNAFNGNLYLKPVCLSLYLLFVSITGLIALWQATDMQSQSDVRSHKTPWQKCPHLREMTEKEGRSRRGRAMLLPEMVATIFSITFFLWNLVLMHNRETLW